MGTNLPGVVYLSSSPKRGTTDCTFPAMAPADEPPYVNSTRCSIGAANFIPLYRKIWLKLHYELPCRKSRLVNARKRKINATVCVIFLPRSKIFGLQLLEHNPDPVEVMLNRAGSLRYLAIVYRKRTLIQFRLSREEVVCCR